LAVETSPTAKAFPVSATGPIHALGMDTPLSNNTDRFAFPKGNLAITHHKTSGSQHFDKTNCTGRITEQGIFQITGGTKAYANASGHGTYSLVGYFIGCSQSKPPQAMSIVIQAAGPINLPG
jgi:hypothetical protein